MSRRENLWELEPGDWRLVHLEADGSAWTADLVEEVTAIQIMAPNGAVACLRLEKKRPARRDLSVERQDGRAYLESGYQTAGRPGTPAIEGRHNARGLIRPTSPTA